MVPFPQLYVCLYLVPQREHFMIILDNIPRLIYVLLRNQYQKQLTKTLFHYPISYPSIRLYVMRSAFVAGAVQ